MRKLLIVSVVFAVLLGGCAIPLQGLVGSGILETREYDITGFDQVEASGTFKVSITQGDDFKVLVTSDDNLADRVEVVKQGDTLTLGLDGPGFGGTLQAEVTLPTLAGVRMSGASPARFTGFGAVDRFDAAASGASELSGELVAATVNLELSGASEALLSGEATDLNLEASGASKAILPDFAIVNADVDISGASNAQLTVSGEIRGDVSGASSLRYAGDPARVRVDSSGASSIQEE